MKKVAASAREATRKRAPCSIRAIGETDHPGIAHGKGTATMPRPSASR